MLKYFHALKGPIIGANENAGYISSRPSQSRSIKCDVCRELQAGRDLSEAGPSTPSEAERETEGEGQTVIRMTAQGPRKLTLFTSERE